MIETTAAANIIQRPVRPRYQNTIETELSKNDPMAAMPKQTKLTASETSVTNFTRLLKRFISFSFATC